MESSVSSTSLAQELNLRADAVERGEDSAMARYEQRTRKRTAEIMRHIAARLTCASGMHFHDLPGQSIEEVSSLEESTANA